MNTAADFGVTSNGEEMYVRPITVATTVHFIASIIVWFSLFGVVLGLGFKDDWNAYDYFYAYSIKGLSYVLCFPSWWIIKEFDPGVSGAVILPIQIVSSFVQANIILAFWKAIAGRNKKLQPSADAPAE